MASMMTDTLLELIESSVKRMKKVEAEDVSDSFKYGWCLAEGQYIEGLLKFYKEETKNGQHENIRSGA